MRSENLNYLNFICKILFFGLQGVPEKPAAFSRAFTFKALQNHFTPRNKFEPYIRGSKTRNLAASPSG